MSILDRLFGQCKMSGGKESGKATQEGRSRAFSRFGAVLIVLALLLPFLAQIAFAQPTVLTWTTKAPMPTDRYGFAVGVVNNKIYAIGGHDSNPGPSGVLTKVEEYDPATNTWTTKASMPTGREMLAVGVVNNKIYAVGGWNGCCYAFATVEEYDPATNTWTTKAPMPTSRTGLAIGVVNNKIYAIGGDPVDLTTVEEYDPLWDTWTTKAPMPTGRSYLAIGVMNNKIYAIGGWRNGIPLTTVEEYDLAADTWTTKAPMPTSRIQLAVGVANNKIYAIGGYPGYLTTVEEYDPLTNSWTTGTPMPTGRTSLAIGVVNNKIYAIGGYGYPGWLHTVEEGTLVPDITPYDFSGFFPPVDNPPTLNGVKAGRAIPVKFSLNGDQGLDIFDAGFPASQQIACDVSATPDLIEETTTAGKSSLSYDATTDQYVYVWKTDKGWAGTCRQLIVQLNDGTAHVAYFNFTK